MPLYRLFLQFLTLFVCLACHWSCATNSEPSFEGEIPSRSSDAPGAKILLPKLAGADEGLREDIILHEFESGNVPDFLRKPISIRFNGRTRSGKNTDVVLSVLPDYLALGSDQDFVRVPMSPVTAQKIADRYNLLLPTTKMVDLFYQLAKIHLAPHPFPPGPSMVSVPTFYRHQSIIQEQLRNKAPYQLIAGHKKDLVLTNRLMQHPDKVAIYGWHQLNGKAIQPLSTVHGYWYADYSHGVRLINPLVLINGKERKLIDVLQDRDLAPLLSYEGPLSIVRYPVEKMDLHKRWWPQS